MYPYSNDGPEEGVGPVILNRMFSGDAEIENAIGQLLNFTQMYFRIYLPWSRSLQVQPLMLVVCFVPSRLEEEPRPTSTKAIAPGAFHLEGNHSHCSHAHVLFQNRLMQARRIGGGSWSERDD